MRILSSATVALRRIVDIGLVGLILVVLVGIVIGKGAPLVGRQSIIVGGGSMEPALGLGSAIVVKPVAAAELAVGDIVSLRVGPDRTTYTHRIVAVVDRSDGRWIRTKGDANADPDPSLVPATAVIGRVELVVPLFGYLLALLSLPLGVMFVIGLAATLLAIAWLLESLEPEPRQKPRPDAGPVPSLELGEPIPARPNRAPAAGGVGAGWTATSMFSGPLATALPSSTVARPNVRDQIERSREVRRRRARWLTGHAHDRRASE
ncbi:MAG: signal peptidase [Chloroflexota bacterium]|jgi:signal peptidase|nr:signal peptidase [Chloroflexota bacterium]